MWTSAAFTCSMYFFLVAANVSVFARLLSRFLRSFYMRIETQSVSSIFSVWLVSSALAANELPV